MSSAARESAGPACIVRELGRQDYEPLWRRMQAFTDARDATTPDELWLAEHPPVFTLGMAASREHVLAPGDIPLVQIDRGGQVTYHGPGQLMVYPMIDVRRARIGVRALVTALETSVVRMLAPLGIEAAGRRDAPGVYAGGRKLASIGLRIRRGASYHGMALNVDMNLEPFLRINPCGFAGLEVTDLRGLGAALTLRQAATALTPLLLEELGLRRAA